MARPILTVVLLVSLFGILVPYYKRYDFLDPVLLAAYFCLPLVLAAPMAADSLAGSATTVAATVRSVLLVALYGWGLGMVIIAAGLITVNAVIWHGHVLMPGAVFLAAGALFSGTSALAVVILGGFIAHRFSASTAKMTLRLLFLSFLIALVVLVRMASPETTALFWQHTTSPELTRVWSYTGVFLLVADSVSLAALARMRRAA